MDNIITAAARNDKTYRALIRKLCNAERQLDEVEPTMTDRQRDAMWEFYERMEDVNQRLLEIAAELCINSPAVQGNAFSGD